MIVSIVENGVHMAKCSVEVNIMQCLHTYRAFYLAMDLKVI